MKIMLRKPWNWYGGFLPGGIIYEVGQTYQGYPLQEQDANAMIESEYAEVVEW